MKFVFNPYPSINFFQYDPKTGVLSPSSQFIEAVCAGNKKYLNEVANLIEGVQILAQDISSPLEGIDQELDENSNISFQRLKTQIMSAEPNIEKINSDISNFSNSHFEHSDNTKIPGQIWLAKLFAKYATKESMNIIDKKAPFRCLPLDYAYLIPEKSVIEAITIDSDVFKIKEDLIDRLNDMKIEPPDFIYSMLRQELSNAIVNEYIDQSPRMDPQLKNRINPKYIHSKNIVEQLIQMINNPGKYICKDPEVTDSSLDNTRTTLVNWCNTNDTDFKLYLESVATQANKTASLMKNGKAANIVRSVVGNGGKYCRLDGFFHLLKKDNEILMYTSGDLKVARNSSIEKVRFEPADIINVLGANTINFKVLK